MLEIQPQHLTFGRLLSGRLFRIPQYQRAYSWTSKQRRELFEDIDRTWIMGPGGYHFLATVVGLRREKVKIITDDHYMIEVVDGQQRLTTLILLMKAISKAVNRTEAIGTKIGTELDEILVKPDKASLLLLQTNHDTSSYFADYIRTGKYPGSETALTVADRELLSAIAECEHYVARWQTRGDGLADLVSLLKNQLTCIFHEISDEALVYSVFEVLNSRGLEVSWFDRLKSMLMAIVFETGGGNKTEILNEVHQLWSDIYECVGLRIGMSAESLQFAATLSREVCPNKPVGLADAAELLRERSKSGPASVIATTRWLKAVTDSVDSLQADRRIDAVTRILQARMVATAVLLRTDLTDTERNSALRRWENVTFRIYGLVDKDARTAVGDYVRLAWRIVREKPPVTQILDELTQIGKQFPIENASKTLAGMDRYTSWQEELRYFFCRYEEHLAQQAGQKFDNEQWNRIWEASAASSIEHILPQSAGDEYWVHRLGNLLILPPGLNSKLGSKPPKEKTQAYEKTGLLVAQETLGYLSNWDLSAIKAREDKLLLWAVQEWAD